MNHINSALIEGILVADPKRIDLSDAPEGCRLVKFDVASDRYYMDRNGKKAKNHEFLDITLKRPLAYQTLHFIFPRIVLEISMRR